MQLSRRGALLGGLSVAGLAACGNPGADREPTASELASAGPLVAVGDLTVGEAKVIKVAGGNLAVLRTSDTDVVAHSAQCTHTGCTVKAAGTELHCPCHGSRFDAATGQVLEGPAPAPLDAFPMRIEGDQVVSA